MEAMTDDNPKDLSVETVEKSFKFDDASLYLPSKAAEAVKEELTCLEKLNKRKAIQEIAELFEISAAVLGWFVEYGEEEAERMCALKN